MTPSYALGLLFIFLVSVIWSAASIVVQYLYHDQHFESPFLLTYIGTSLFVTLLPTRLLWERRKRIVAKLCWCRKQPQGQEENDEVIPWTNNNNANYQEVPTVPQEESFVSSSTSKNELQLEMSNKEVSNISETTATTTESVSVVRGGPPGDLVTEDSALQPERVPTTRIVLSHKDHFKMAMKIAPVWFLANWAYNTSLAYTSITSSTVLASTGSLFTFLFAIISRDEDFTLLKLSGVLLGIVGSVVTGLHDIHDHNHESLLASTACHNTTTNTELWNCTSEMNNNTLSEDGSEWGDGHKIWGDVIGLLSAVGYGAYTILIRLLCPRDESCMSMQLLLGYVGLLNGLVLLPIAIKLVVSSPNNDLAIPINMTNVTNDNASFATTQIVQQQLTWVVFGYLVAKGMLDNVLSDYLWARAVVLTSATVATVGLGLTIPLAFVSDYIMGNKDVMSWQSIVGALAVLCGFVLVNLDNNGETDQEQQQQEEVIQ